MSFIKSIWPLSKKKREDLASIGKFLEKSDLKEVKHLLRHEKVGVSYQTLKVSKKLIEDALFPSINPAMEDSEIIAKSKIWNDCIEQQVREKKYLDFSTVAKEKIKDFIAPHIVGMDVVKKAAQLQLFATDKTHILLLGDPGTGKTDILRSVNDLAPIASFGLGSGTSGVGLTAAVKGKEITIGLLPMADNGICCIDELNLMKTRDRGSLLNAMEKGFVTYDKANNHLRFDARISVLATANPKGDKFVGRKPDIWLKQIPFDPALLTRFHLVFFIRKPNQQEFIDIAKKIVSDRQKNLEINDELFIKDYIEYAHMIDVKFDEKLKKDIIEFASKLKIDEDEFLVDIGPRIILGIMRLAKASARIELRNVVDKTDLETVFEIIKTSLYVKDHKKRKK